MTTPLLIVLILFFSTLLLILVYFLIRRNKRKNRPAAQTQETEAVPPRSFQAVIAAIEDRNASAAMLEQGIDELFGNYGVVKQPAKKPENKLENYVRSMAMLCRHPRANKELVLRFERKFHEKNPALASLISDTMMQSLSHR